MAGLPQSKAPCYLGVSGRGAVVIKNHGVDGILMCADLPHFPSIIAKPQIVVVAAQHDLQWIYARARVRHSHVNAALDKGGMLG